MAECTKGLMNRCHLRHQAEVDQAEAPILEKHPERNIKETQPSAPDSDGRRIEIY